MASSAALFSILLVISCAHISPAAANFYQLVDITWGDGRGQITGDGELLELSLDESSGSGFQSKNDYLYGRFDMQLKLIPGNSAGTVTTFYLSSQGSLHDEIDFEFLGNASGSPYTIHTNVYSQGKGDREMQFMPWFDPTIDYHTYSFLWNPTHIVFYVDGIPIREFKNRESIGVAYPNSQSMRVYSSLWDADDWATQGGRVKTDWSQAPFVAWYRNFTADGCISSGGGGGAACSSANNSWMLQQLDSASLDKMKWVQTNYMIYNYCTDLKRFPQGLPPECTAQN